MINTEGINAHQSMIRAIRDFKVNAILTESLFRTKAVYDKQLIENSTIDILERAKHDMRHQMAQKILDIHPPIETKDDDNPFKDQVTLELELIVINPKQLKIALEHIVRQLTPQQIEDIKNYV